jgi:hypothetical protein
VKPYKPTFGPWMALGMLFFFVFYSAVTHGSSL